MGSYDRLSYVNFLILMAFFVCSIATTYYINLILQNNSNPQMAFAHQTSKYGNYTLEYGWIEEPVLIDEINDIVVGVTTDSENSSSPVRNALAEMDIKVKYGGITKDLAFVPSQEEAGLYEAEILPTRLGSYDLVVNGTIKGQVISDEVQIEDVESKDKISFPESGDNAAAAGTFNADTESQLSKIPSQLTNDLDVVRQDLATSANITQELQDGISAVDKETSRSFMIGMTGIGLGIAGILIGAIALSRR
ncbi:MAG: hypothetical protein ACRD5E_07480 [Nitrososphaeraceae archaeon]